MGKLFYLLFSFFITQIHSEEIPWVPLFNGKDLSGWKIVSLKDPGSVSVKNSEMILRQRINTQEHSFVTTERLYRDFILELEVNADLKVNSGILLRAIPSSEKAKIRLNGYQVKIDDTPRAWTGGVFDDFGDSWTWLHDLSKNPEARSAFKQGEWAKIRIECIGSSIKTWINDISTCHLINQKYDEGHIAFKIHSLGNQKNIAKQTIRFRNIRILTDPPSQYLQTCSLPPSLAPTTPGIYDKASPKQCSP